MMRTGNLAFGVGRSDKGHVDFDVDERVGGVVHFADEIFGDDWVESRHLVVDAVTVQVT